MPKLLRWKSHVKLRLTHREATHLREILDLVDAARCDDRRAILRLRVPSPAHSKLVAKLLLEMHAAKEARL